MTKLKIVNAQSRSDWEKYAQHARVHGFWWLVARLAPRPFYGFRMVDRRIMQLRKELELRGLSCKLEW